MTDHQQLFEYTLRQADNCMVLCQRLAAWCANAPELEEDIALTNISLDLIGQARSLYQYAGELEGQGRTEDDLAYLRDEREWFNLLIVEQPNGDFADTIARQFLFDCWHLGYLKQLQQSKDAQLSAIAAKSVKESTYHLRHSSQWLIRLGDGTDESHQRMQAALDRIWRFTPEMFIADNLDDQMLESGIGVDLSLIHEQWQQQVKQVLEQATLTQPEDSFPATGGRNGIHTEHMGYLLAEMQILHRSYPGCQW